VGSAKAGAAPPTYGDAQGDPPTLDSAQEGLDRPQVAFRAASTPAPRRWLFR